MSDEHEHHNHPHMFAFQMGPSPEQLEQMRMGAEASAHDTRAFLDGLTPDQLQMFGRILRVVAGEESVATYYVGLTLGLLHAKFNICLACGKNHDSLLDEMRGPVEPEKIIEDEESEYIEFGSDRYNDLCAEYGVVPTGEGYAVACVDCNTKCVSLQDRMLRQPGKLGCATCIQKEKWG